MPFEPGCLIRTNSHNATVYFVLLRSSRSESHVKGNFISILPVHRCTHCVGLHCLSRSCPISAGRCRRTAAAPLPGPCLRLTLNTAHTVTVHLRRMQASCPHTALHAARPHPCACWLPRGRCPDCSRRRCLGGRRGGNPGGEGTAPAHGRTRPPAAPHTAARSRTPAQARSRPVCAR